MAQNKVKQLVSDPRELFYYPIISNFTIFIILQGVELWAML